MSSTLPRLPLFEAIAGHDPKSTAIVHSASGRRFTYGELLNDVADARGELLKTTSEGNMDGERVAFLAENSYDYVVTLLSILASNAIALPIAPSFPAHEVRYILENSEAITLLATERYQDKAGEVLREGLEKTPRQGFIEKKMGGSSSEVKVKLQNPSKSEGGMMLYTSGTTNRPKGVVLPESVLTAQARSLIKAWRYSSQDHILHVLPLHHIHGTVNALLTPLFAGSVVEFLFPFNADAVYQRMAAPFLPLAKDSDRDYDKITFWTMVPTIYNRLLSTFPNLPEEIQRAVKSAISPENLRLNISGSAALPTPTKSAWKELSNGNDLLERYGMTEVGMALSCGLAFEDRVDGSVGWPLPDVEVRLVDLETNETITEGKEIDKEGQEREGEIQLRGPTIFKEYWRNSKATAAEFVDAHDGKGPWFKTGDVALRRKVAGAGKSDQEWAKGPMYFIRGRRSVDIFKTGGEKVSALEIERELLALRQISEVAVVGVESEQWGQKVVAVVVLDPDHAQTGRGGKTWGPMDMRRALKDKLVNYKIPHELKVVDSISRNAMGKVNKKALVKELFPDQAS